ncbi:putative urea active transporter 1 [Colletotrichum spinosum]|uniref:Putative urea active transporter 1 n=1 Tax=Colletotrichum spinosum TaxID=1347390 RepID=A0A4R8QBJ6_9PEZI|nr:putative urea active transporter 1 [Colletotrichum spinosum]
MSLQHRADDGVVIPSPLPQSVGYGVVVAVGLVFAFCMMGVTAILKKTLHEDNSNAETFMVANRSVRPGLVASAVVSSWLWSTALLSCVLVTYSYGISGAFWYGGGCSTVIVFFGFLGVVCKARIPEAHTVLEVIRLRYGTVAHLSFTFLAVINNLLNTVNMILGASAAISFLFLTDYIHTFIILILCCWLTIKVITFEAVGSIGGLYDLVVAAEGQHYVDGNYKGSLLTMTSQQGIFFAIILLVSNAGAVIMDTGYFLKAFAAAPSTVVGMAALGLESLPVFPTYPRLMTSTEVTNGLALPYVAVAVAGKGGAVAVLLMTFMAVTSTLVYVNQSAGNKQIIRWGHIGVVSFGLVSAGFTAMFHYIGVDMGWTLYMLGVAACPGVVPTIFTITWRKQTRIAAVSSAFLGMATGFGVWLGSAYAFSGEVSIASTGGTLPCMYGTVASLFSPLLYSAVISFIRPDNYDWNDFK